MIAFYLSRIVGSKWKYIRAPAISAYEVGNYIYGLYTTGNARLAFPDLMFVLIIMLI